MIQLIAGTENTIKTTRGFPFNEDINFGGANAYVALVKAIGGENEGFEASEIYNSCSGTSEVLFNLSNVKPGEWLVKVYSKDRGMKFTTLANIKK